MVGGRGVVSVTKMGSKREIFVVMEYSLSWFWQWFHEFVHVIKWSRTTYTHCIDIN